MPLKLLKSKFNDGTGKFIFQIDKMPADKRSSRLTLTGSTRAMGKARSERKRRLMKALVEWFGAAVTKKVSVGRERPDLPLPPWRMNPYSDS